MNEELESLIISKIISNKNILENSTPSENDLISVIESSIPVLELLNSSTGINSTTVENLLKLILLINNAQEKLLNYYVQYNQYYLSQQVALAAELSILRAEFDQYRNNN